MVQFYLFRGILASGMYPPHFGLSSMVVWTSRPFDLWKKMAGLLEPKEADLLPPFVVVRWRMLAVLFGKT